MRLTDEQIERFVSTLLPPVLYSVFSTSESSSAYSVMRNMAFLAPQLVLPRALDLLVPFYTSFIVFFQRKLVFKSNRDKSVPFC
ncbi:unnamed protein product [Gongylonema pulchrum]|uniref:BLM10_mid domain-containing protein n=1 Tax=Gongylonema pulchrum TaxID=637853 RepID=A0A183DG12_9BILA|nr:unnamed protein product [Gongylonema pulchrum]